MGMFPSNEGIQPLGGESSETSKCYSCALPPAADADVRRKPRIMGSDQ
jgi:hypothetical protein